MNTVRNVITAETVVKTRDSRRKRIEVMAGDIVTAEARDRAQLFEIELVEGPLEKPLPKTTDGATALMRGLWRRSPRWVAPTHGVTRSSHRFKKIAFVGTGGVGSTTAHLCANLGMADEIALIDICPGLAEATALDLNHATGVTRSLSRCVGGTSLDMVEGAEVVLVSAGLSRKPGMTRAELTDVNRRIVQAVGEVVAARTPNAIIIVVTNPLDEMTYEMLQVTGFPRNRIIGMAGTLDSSRFRNYLAKAAEVEVRDVEAVTLGSHGDEMVPVVSNCRIKGRPPEDFLNSDQISECVEKTINGGGSVVTLKKTGSAIIAPAHSAVELLDHMRGAKRGWVPASVLLKGEYGIDGVILGVPCLLGMNGLIEVVELKLKPSEIDALKRAADAIKYRMTN